jgi:hypothetical protein
MEPKHTRDGKKLSTWNEWGNHILLELQRQNDCIESLNKKLSSMKEDSKDDVSDMKDELIEKINDLEVEFNAFKSRMQVKSGVWGLIGGMIPTAIALIYIIIRLSTG